MNAVESLFGTICLAWHPDWQAQCYLDRDHDGPHRCYVELEWRDAA